MGTTAALAILTLASISRVACAGTAIWRSHGPDGGLVNALAIDPATPSTLYAGTQGGVFKSTDGATSWSATGFGPVFALAIDSTTPSTVYAGTYGGGVLKSTTGGGSWGGLNDGLTSKIVFALAVDPADPSSLYSGTYGGGVFALHVCGNGTRESGEECDDGNGTSDDGCSATCTLEPCGLSPLPLCRVALQALLQLSEKTPGKERLKVQWKKLSGSSTTVAFGDPVAGTTRVVLCLYDDGGTLIHGYEVDRAAQLCAGKPCWVTKGTNGYGYKDKLAADDGITKIGYKAGAPDKGKADAAGANDAAKGQTALPTGVVAALSGNTQPTIQLLTSDGFCVGATMTEVTKDDGVQYQARKK